MSFGALPVFALALTLAAGGGCGTPRDQTPPERGQASQGKTPLEDSLLRRSAGRAYRDSVGLHVRLRDGTFVVLVDDTTESHRTAYSFDGWNSDLGSYVIDVALYEGGGTDLVSDRTGKVTKLAGPPVVSPSGKRFAVAMPFDFETSPPSSIAVYKADSAGVTQEWFHALDRWAPSELTWLSDTVIRIHRQDMNDSHEPVGPGGEVLVRFLAGAWRVAVP